MHPSEFEKIFQFEGKHWWFAERRRLLRFLLERFVPDRNATVLDVGCGTGHHLLYLARLGYARARGIDLAPQAIAFCHRLGLTNVQTADATRLPFPDAAVDAVLACDVVEHLADDRRALRELARVLKPGGVAIITVPAFHFLWSRHDEVLQHYRRYRMADVVQLVTGQPFTVAYWSYLFCAIFPAVVVYRWFARLLRLERTSDLEATAEPFNTLLTWVGSAEVATLRAIPRLPFGTSLAVVLRRS